MNKPVTIEYADADGRRRLRIVPSYLWWGKNGSPRGEGWHLHAFDADTHRPVDFNWHSIRGPGDIHTKLVATTRIK